MANKHFVICARCGKQFDANRGASYNPHTGRYVCKGCTNAQTTGMRQSYGAMIAKIGFGILFVLAGFSTPEEGWTMGYFLTALVCGGALIAWGLLPYLNAKKAKAQQEAIVPPPAPPRVWNCPNCGGRSSRNPCEYCDSPIQ